MESFIKENGLKMEIIEKENGFYPGSNINGNVIITNKEINPQTIMIQLTMIQYWNNKNLLNNITIIKEKKINTNNFSEIDFTFEIPEDLEPSFEYFYEDTFVYSRYFLETKCISNNQLYNCSYIILIKAKYINIISPLNYNSKKNVTRFKFDKGVCSCNIFIDQNYITFDDELKLNIEINNTNCLFDISKLKATIERELIVISLNKEKMYYEKTVNSRKIKEILIKNGTNDNQEMNISIKDDSEKFNTKKWNNPYNNDKKIIKYIPSLDTLHIKCIYKIKFTTYFDAFFVSNKKRPRIFIPIYIGHQNKDEYYNIQKKNKISIFNSEQLIDGFKSLNQNIDDYKIIEEEEKDFIY